MNELLGNSAVQLFGVCYLLLVLKMVALGGYTSVLRIRRRVYASPEDYKVQGVRAKAAGTTDADIERVRRAHRNDLETVLPFFGVGLFYALTASSMLGPQISFIGFTLARILHGPFYVLGMQPHRTIAFGVGWLLMLWMLLAAGVSLLTLP